MRIAFFTHSLRSDWNHGNAHFLRGLATELGRAGHRVTAFEPSESWSASNLVATAGADALEDYRRSYPTLPVQTYAAAQPDIPALLEGIDLALVHEWNDPEIVAAIGRERLQNPKLRILFHDTHHRCVTAPEEMARFDLAAYDGILAFGDSVRERYRQRGWGSRVWTFHEAADTNVFYPRAPMGEGRRDLVWVGNWGDDERTSELREFLIEPVATLGLSATIFGVRYPEHALAELARGGLEYRGFLPNTRVPEIFAEHRFTVHVPRGPYAAALPGVPTIRMFEALACGIPLISAPWSDVENLFPEGCYLRAANGDEMSRQMRWFLDEPEAAAAMATRGLAVIREKHTCAHRARQLVDIYAAIAPQRAEAAA